MDIIFMVIFVFPLAAFFLGWLTQLFLQKIWIAPLMVFLISLAATFLVFNPTFWIWVVIYTLLALTGSVLGRKQPK